jgi:cysteine desulfurase
VFGVLREDLKDGAHIITSTIEHSAVLNTCRQLETLGMAVTYVPVNASCLVDPDDVRRALRPNTQLISIMMANNETGVLQPVEEIGKIAAEADVYFHTDAVQAAGKVAIDVERIGCDLLTISGHKIHAPQGVGALYVRKGTQVTPRLFGGRHERSRRAGTENVPAIVGLGKSAEFAHAGFANGEVALMSSLRDQLQSALLHEVDEAVVNGAGAPRVPNTTNIRFEHVEGEALVIALDLKGLAVSTGAACSSGAIEPSHVLTAMGLRPDQARASIRFSLGKQSKPEDVDFALSLVPATVAKLRELSPVYAK